MRLKIFFLFCYLSYFLSGSTSCVPLNVVSTPSNPTQNNTQQPSQTLPFKTENTIYQENIKTIILAPQNETPLRSLQPPIIPLSQPIALQLEFDDLQENYQDYSFKIIHCNADWTISRLNALEYLEEYNEFPIQNYQPSFNTKVKYVHYKALLPRVKVTGNFLVVVYPTANPEKPIFSWRFLVYENLLTIVPKPRFSTDISTQNENQQIDFEIFYNTLTLTNPREEFWVVVRQNDRWDNALQGLKPVYVREFEKKLEYVYFNGENNFQGGNEFRRFDAQSLLFLGFNMEQIDVSGTDNRVRLQSDKPRGEQPYLLQQDMNGGFYIQNAEMGSGEYEADYIKVYFTLKTPQPFPTPVYVVGQFNQWQLSQENQLQYYPEESAYQKSILLKQGVYEYYYVLKDAEKLNHSFLEGNHAQTLNQYEILVYYRPLNARFEQLIGYSRFLSQE